MRRRDVKRPLIFAHRGACKVAPENTLPAFQAALDLGADGIELDVQFSSDGKLVVLHNPNLETTTNGAGRVTAYTFAELRLLDAGSHFGPQFAGTPLPALDEVLDLCHGKLLMTIELKSLNSSTANIGVDVVAAVRARDMADQVVISSFNPLALRRAKKAGPEIECALLTAPDLPGWMRAGLTFSYSRANAVHPEFPMVDATYMAWAAKRNMPVRPWTVNEVADMQRMIALGVDSIITDVPDVLVGLLSGHLVSGTTPSPG
jgi:glycerophosphoryl diester phosphodiesterase